MPLRESRALLKAAATLALALTLAACSAPSTPPAPPNIIVIVADTLRADRVSWDETSRGQRHLTPFLRSLAARGTVFWNAYAQSSWTVPSVASLFTSRYPTQHGVTRFTSQLSSNERTLAEYLGARDYATAAFVANIACSRERGFDQGFGTFSMVVPEQAGKARAPELNAAALRWLDGRSGHAPERPFFLYLHYMEPHIPFTPPRAALEAIVHEHGPDPARMRRLEDGQRFVNKLLATVHGPAPERAYDLKDEGVSQALRDLYDAEVSSLDGELRALFTALEQRKLLDNALVIFTADHGEELFDHGRLGHGTTLHQETVHVPLLLVAPGQAQRIDVREAVSLVDVAPTILGWLGPLPEAPFEGTPLWNTVDRAHGARRWLAAIGAWVGMADAREPAFTELVDLPFDHASKPLQHRRAAISADRKVIERLDGSVLAFDLEVDELERAPALVMNASATALRRALASFTAHVGHAAPAAANTRLDEVEKERLRALGYAQ